MERDIKKSAGSFILRIILYAGFLCHNNPEICYYTHFMDWDSEAQRQMVSNLPDIMQLVSGRG